MGDKISNAERAEITAFILRKGVTRCPDGEAMNAHIDWKMDGYETVLSREQVNVVPIVFTISALYGSNVLPNTRANRAWGNFKKAA